MGEGGAQVEARLPMRIPRSPLWGLGVLEDKYLHAEGRKGVAIEVEGAPYGLIRGDGSVHSGGTHKI